MFTYCVDAALFISLALMWLTTPFPVFTGESPFFGGMGQGWGWEASRQINTPTPTLHLTLIQPC